MRDLGEDLAEDGMTRYAPSSASEQASSPLWEVGTLLRMPDSPRLGLGWDDLLDVGCDERGSATGHIVGMD